MSMPGDWSNSTFLLSVDPTTGSGLTWCAPFSIMGVRELSIDLKPVSGTLNGYFVLQRTNFGVDAKALPVSGDWVDVANSANNGAGTGAVNAVISATIGWDIASPGGKWYRIRFSNNGSTSPLVSVAISGKRIQ